MAAISRAVSQWNAYQLWLIPHRHEVYNDLHARTANQQWTKVSRTCWMSLHARHLDTPCDSSIDSFASQTLLSSCLTRARSCLHHWWLVHWSQSSGITHSFWVSTCVSERGPVWTDVQSCSNRWCECVDPYQSIASGTHRSRARWN